MKWPGVIKYYQRFLPLKDDQYIVTLLEGNTPLIEAKRLREHINPALKLFLKCEGLNPTSSFKDRGMTMALSKALEAGSQAVICASLEIPPPQHQPMRQELISRRLCLFLKVKLLWASCPRL